MHYNGDIDWHTNTTTNQDGTWYTRANEHINIIIVVNNAVHVKQPHLAILEPEGEEQLKLGEMIETYNSDDIICQQFSEHCRINNLGHTLRYIDGHVTHLHNYIPIKTKLCIRMLSKL